jgi:hypothetical protein
MGDRVDDRSLLALDDENVEAVRRRLRDSTRVLRTMIDDGRFVEPERRPGDLSTIGLEVELDLVDELGHPRLVNEPVLDRLRRDDIQHELAQFNLEVNVSPRPLRGAVLSELERDLAATLRDCAAQSADFHAYPVSIGMLPTLRSEHLTYGRLSNNPRYELLSQRMRMERRGPFRVAIEGIETLAFAADTVAPEAAATSLQLHLRVTPADFPRYYNAAQAIAGAQVAAGANAVYLLERQLWQETRIALCEQILDTRGREDTVRGSPPRVWLGDRWIADPVEVLQDTVDRFPPLLPALTDEDPVQVLAAGRIPALRELRLHNGTVWRWNRPVYDVVGDRPHLRIENRVLPSGPTVVDMVANAALYYGLLRSIADDDPPVSTRLPFVAAEGSLQAAAQRGLDAPDALGRPSRTVRDALLHDLLPRAAAGLDGWGVDPACRDRLLGIIEDRVRTGQTGAGWQVATVRWLESRGLTRTAALAEMTRRYLDLSRAGQPVHTWPVG